MGGKFGEFGELSMTHQTKTIQISNNLLTDLLIRQTFFAKYLERTNSPNFSAAKIHGCVSTVPNNYTRKV